MHFAALPRAAGVSGASLVETPPPVLMLHSHARRFGELCAVAGGLCGPASLGQRCHSEERAKRSRTMPARCSPKSPAYQQSRWCRWRARYLHPSSS